MANLFTCDCCGKRARDQHTVYVGKHRVEWTVCADCLNNKVPRISKDTEVPLLSLRFPFGARGR
jgi:hypothetical protein